MNALRRSARAGVAGSGRLAPVRFSLLVLFLPCFVNSLLADISGVTDSRDTFAPCSNVRLESEDGVRDPHPHRWRTASPSSLDQVAAFEYGFTLRKEDASAADYSTSALQFEYRTYDTTQTVVYSRLANYFGITLRGRRYEYSETDTQEEYSLTETLIAPYGGRWTSDRDSKVFWSYGVGTWRSRFSTNDIEDDGSLSVPEVGFCQRLLEDRLFVTFDASLWIPEDRDSEVMLSSDLRWKSGRWPVWYVGVTPSLEKGEDSDAEWAVRIRNAFDWDFFYVSVSASKDFSGAFEDADPRLHVSLSHVVGPGWSYSVAWGQADSKRSNEAVVRSEEGLFALVYSW